MERENLLRKQKNPKTKLAQTVAWYKKSQKRTEVSSNIKPACQRIGAL